MAKKKNGKKKEPESRGRKRATFFLLAVLCAAGLFLLRCEALTGLKTYVLGAGTVVIEELADLPASPPACAVPAEIVGIPDYANVFRAEPRGGGPVVTCFRIVSFENRLLACASQGLSQPQDIEEIIRKKRFAGALRLLEGSSLEVSVRQGFRQKVGETLPRGAFLLEAGKTAVPSVRKFALLVFLAVVCCFSAYKAIKG